MPVEHRSDFKQALSTLQQLKKEFDKRPRTLAEINNERRVLLHGGIGKILGGILHLSITAMMDPALIDRSGKHAKTVIGPIIIRGKILNTNSMQYYSENSVTANSS